METVITKIIIYLLIVVAGILLGNGAVYLFNRMPGKWFLDVDGTLPDGAADGRNRRKVTGAGSAADNGALPDGAGKDGAADGRDRPGTPVDVFGAAGMESLEDAWTTDEEGSLRYRPQRVRSTPWKYYFSMLFIAAGLYMARADWIYAVSALPVLWILLELSISDIKYRIVPDQFLILLVVSAIGMVPYHSASVMSIVQLGSGWQDMLFGAAAGLGIMGATAVLGRAMYKRDTVGGGDIRLFAALGLVLGVSGILSVFILSSLLSGAHMVLLLASRRIKRKDTVPMVPYIAASAGIFIIFFWQGPFFK